ncbi:hypothetical protein K1X12_12590 [Hyphomonas sp. WL0036]|uniref:hypothetical protein n=1 Tax=Hyphomonas sediminis TaxID=2866160 RepID=UPI001C826133|nr:hypothetical protein [Hyphomonas sediminis]MBY9067742.1 hypothetical protein [Hyphomonas sediminis]
MSDRNSPDLNFEVGYNVATSKASFSISISNIFDRIGKKKFGFSVSRWRTKGWARKDAKQGIPPTHSVEPDGQELEIRTERDQQLTKVSNAVDSAVDDATKWVNKHTPQKLHRDKLENDVKAAIAGELADYRDSLQKAREELTESKSHYEDFRHEHGLKRNARVPLFFLKPIVILLALLLGETIINAFIFAGISPQGMIGGWLTALVISVINIIFGLVFGFAIIRYAMVWEGTPRYLLMFAGGLLILLAFLFNLYVAHFREVAEAAILADQAGEAILTRDRAPTLTSTWPHFIENPFNIGSVLGIGLLVIGLSIFGIAAYEGYCGFTDPYPGFGRVGKRYYLNEITVSLIESSARKRAFSRLDAIRHRLNDSLTIHRHFQNEVNTAISFADRLSKAAATAEKQVNNHAWLLISDYRAANRRKRTKLKQKAEKKPEKALLNPGDAPAYFDVDPRASWGAASVVPSSEELSSMAQASKTTISENIAIIDFVSKYVSELRTRIASSVQGLDEEIRRSMSQSAPSATVSPHPRLNTVQ